MKAVAQTNASKICHTRLMQLKHNIVHIFASSIFHETRRKFPIPVMIDIFLKQ